MQVKPILPSLLLIVIIITIIIVLYRVSANPSVIQGFERSQAPSNANSSNAISQKAFDILLSPFFIAPLVILAPLVIVCIWACYKKWEALLVSARNQWADTFHGIMRTLSPFRLFQPVANALEPTYGHFMEWLFTTRWDNLFPAAVTNPTNAFIEWLSSQLDPWWQWVEGVVNSPTFHDVMESLRETLPSFRLTTLRGLQWAAGLEGDRPVTIATETV